MRFSQAHIFFWGKLIRVNYLTFYMSSYLTFRHKQFVNSSVNNTFFHFCDECVAVEQERIFTWFGFLFSEHLIPRMWGAGRLIEFLESLERNRSDSLSWDKSPPPPFIWFISRHNRLARSHLAPTNNPNKTFWYKLFRPTVCSQVCRKEIIFILLAKEQGSNDQQLPFLACTLIIYYD